MASAIHLDLDGAWHDLPMPTIDATRWGPQLRYLTNATTVGRFTDEVVRSLPPFILYGSGDFHHLAAIFIRKFTEPLTVVSFDNHPDWDIRPPRWSCGAWVCRALEIPTVSKVSVWGCGNFELGFPSRLTGNQKAVERGRLEIRPWTERQPTSVQRRFTCVTRDNWRGRFSRFAEGLNGNPTYITVDMDCLRSEEAATNWENGLFTANDLAWAIGQIRAGGSVVGGDLCGAWSKPVYARPFQRFAGWWDHPRAFRGRRPDAAEINLTSLRTIWPILTGEKPYSA